jgi:hypothetical protein
VFCARDIFKISKVYHGSFNFSQSECVPSYQITIIKHHHNARLQNQERKERRGQFVSTREREIRLCDSDELFGICEEEKRSKVKAHTCEIKNARVQLSFVIAAKLAGGRNEKLHKFSTQQI